MRLGTPLRSGACVLVLALLVGCTAPARYQAESIAPGEVRPSKSQPIINDNESSLPGTVVSASSIVPAAGQMSGLEGPSLPPPPNTNAAASESGDGRGVELPASVNPPPPAQPPIVPPPKGPDLPAPQPTPVAATPGTVFAQPVSGNPHKRTMPTAAGAIMGLAPYEVPADRVVEMARKSDMQAAEIAALMLRIRELEAAAISREQSVAESHRDAVAIGTEAARLRADVAALKAQLQQLETEDAEILKEVIAALERLLGEPSNRRAP